MSDYKILAVEEAEDVMGDYPGEMRFVGRNMGCEQVTVTYRRMPPKTGGKGSYGHRHKTQEEIYFVTTGTLQFKLDDEIVEVGPRTAVCVPPHVVRSVWNNGDEDAELIIASTMIEDLRGDGETVDGFWPED
jgi:mannose-6-phosphate isomerase-like protein (cupin superfamily)